MFIPYFLISLWVGTKWFLLGYIGVFSIKTVLKIVTDFAYSLFSEEYWNKVAAKASNVFSLLWELTKKAFTPFVQRPVFWAYLLLKIMPWVLLGAASLLLLWPLFMNAAVLAACASAVSVFFKSAAAITIAASVVQEAALVAFAGIAAVCVAAFTPVLNWFKWAFHGAADALQHWMQSRYNVNLMRSNSSNPTTLFLRFIGFLPLCKSNNNSVPLPECDLSKTEVETILQRAPRFEFQTAPEPKPAPKPESESKPAVASKPATAEAADAAAVKTEAAAVPAEAKQVRLNPDANKATRTGRWVEITVPKDRLAILNEVAEHIGVPPKVAAALATAKAKPDAPLPPILTDGKPIQAARKRYAKHLLTRLFGDYYPQVFGTKPKQSQSQTTAALNKHLGRNFIASWLPAGWRRLTGTLTEADVRDPSHGAGPAVDAGLMPKSRNLLSLAQRLPTLTLKRDDLEFEKTPTPDGTSSQPLWANAQPEWQCPLPPGRDMAQAPFLQDPHLHDDPQQAQRAAFARDKRIKDSDGNVATKDNCLVPGLGRAWMDNYEGVRTLPLAPYHFIQRAPVAKFGAAEEAKRVVRSKHVVDATNLQYAANNRSLAEEHKSARQQSFKPWASKGRAQPVALDVEATLKNYQYIKRLRQQGLSLAVGGREHKLEADLGAIKDPHVAATLRHAALAG